MPDDFQPGVDPSGYYLPGPVQPARSGDSGREIRNRLRQRKKQLAAAEVAHDLVDRLQALPEETATWPENQKTPGRYPPMPDGDGLAIIRQWFANKGWTPWAFQEQAWQAYRQGHSGLVHVPTGAGKTYSAYLGPLSELLEDQPGPDAGLQILFITPLRALTRDIELALKAPVDELTLPITVESRTGDTGSAQRNRQRKNLPHVLITTPESLELLLSQADARRKFSNLRAVIVDEWHELLSSKRGILVELALARLRYWNTQAGGPTLRTWALSATIANLHEAAQAAVGMEASPVIIAGGMSRPVMIDTLLPDEVDRFPWAGHLGGRMLDHLIGAIDIRQSTLVFTNVRSHAERWFMEILNAKPEWGGLMALHHGSLDRVEREFVEHGLKEGFIKLVVCTSSLDLGVDFAPVERVFQIGSPKGIARLIQRAGRAAHRPGAPCRITCVPTHALELIEVAAVREAIGRGEMEGRMPLSKPYDVLAQHLVTCALGGGVRSEEFYREVTRTLAYRDLSREEFDWILDLCRTGGETLRAYPEYRKLEESEDGYVVKNPLISQLHRMNIGTITSDTAITVAYANGKRLGTVEEYFITRLQAGDVFVFAGKLLEFVGMREATAIVKPAARKSTNVPRWDGGKLPFTASLGQAVRETLERAALGDELADVPEIMAARPILEAQQAISRIPRADEVLAEILESREGHHMFLFPFEGRAVHEGLAAVLGLRMTRCHKATFQVSANDYGIEFVSESPFPFQEVLTPDLFSPDDLLADILDSMNLSELARRQFREVARVAGLVYQNYPGNIKTSRQLQTSAGILYDVFRRFDPENLFLAQSRREVLERQFEETRLSQTLRRMQNARLNIVETNQPSPLAFPLMVERIGAHFSLSSETMAERVEKLKNRWMK